MITKLITVFLIIATITYTSYASLGGYICPANKKKLLAVLSKSLDIKDSDIASTYYGAKGYNLLGEQVSQGIVKSICDSIQNQYKHDSTPEVTFNVLSTWSLLKCPGKIHTDVTLKNAKSILENPKSTNADIRYATEALVLLGQPIPNADKIAKVLQNNLKEDDSLTNVGQALHAATLLGNVGKFAQSRIEEIISQADEVDGKQLQWEGGLSITSLLITGILRLNAANSLTHIQADKIGNYLLSRRTVQTPKGVLALLEAAMALASSTVSPVCITPSGPASVTVESPNFKIQVTDIFGQTLKSGVTPVVVQSATRITDDVVVLAKTPLNPGTTPTEFILSLNLEPGYYSLSILAGSHSANLNVRVVGPITLRWLEIGLGDTDGNSAPKLTKLQHPEKLKMILQADASQHLIAKFSTSRLVHQAFIRLYSGSKEIIFVAEPDSSKNYKVDVNLASELSESGIFDIELILGDALITNPIRWIIGSIDINVGSQAEVKSRPTRGAKPEIQHLFRQPEKRPSETVSLLFTALTASPLLLLLILWLKIGVNFGNFTAVALPFHLGLGSILGLFTLFWLKLDMFTTCAILIPIGGFTFFAGHKALSHLARLRKPDKAEK